MVRQVCFEEAGQLRLAAVLVDNEATMQVEAASGKRSKIKKQQVVLQVDTSSNDSLLGDAECLGKAIDVGFLWECAPTDEFHFDALAADYFGDIHTVCDRLAVYFALHAAPMYFHRRGQGRFRKAPPDILKAALAGEAKKREQQQQIEQWVNDLTHGHLPTAFVPHIDALLAATMADRAEAKALQLASTAMGVTTAECLYRCQAFHTVYDFHVRHFFATVIGQPSASPQIEAILADLDTRLTAATADVPFNDLVQAFSIDDSETSEIDDAFSLRWSPSGHIGEIGIHIAVPAVAIMPQSPLAQHAESQMTTIYLPGRKYTMLPPEVVERFTLLAGRTNLALSLYLTLDDDAKIVAHKTVLNRIAIADNLRLEQWGDTPADMAAAVVANRPFAREIDALYRFARNLATQRGDTGQAKGRYDYTFRLHGDLSDPDRCRVDIKPRQRGAPLDTLVAELMIYANAHWGGVLRAAGVPALYRVQAGGKVKMSTVPGPHEGLGVPQYTWCTSPLRRFADLFNQWQLLACLNRESPPYPPRSPLVLVVLRQFDTLYRAAADIQRRIETYWCLRYLASSYDLSAAPARLVGRVITGEKIVVVGLPLVQTLAGMPNLAPGTSVSLLLRGVDLLALKADLGYLETLVVDDETPWTDLDEDEMSAADDSDQTTTADPTTTTTVAPAAVGAI